MARRGRCQHREPGPTGGAFDRGYHEFLTLSAGDVLLVGELPDAPLARAGDRVRVEIEGIAPRKPVVRL